MQLYHSSSVLRYIRTSNCIMNITAFYNIYKMNGKAAVYQSTLIPAHISYILARCYNIKCQWNKDRDFHSFSYFLLLNYRRGTDFLNNFG